MILSEVRHALAAQIRDRVTADVTVVAAPDLSTDLPNVQVWPASDHITYFETFGSAGLATVRYQIKVETTNQDAESAMSLMDGLLSAGGISETGSIVDAIMADQTLSGLVQDVTPTSVDVTVDDETYNLVAFIDVEVILKKQGANA